MKKGLMVFSGAKNALKNMRLNCIKTKWKIGLRLKRTLLKYVMDDNTMNEAEQAALLLKFKQWYDKLSPAEKCTVWPPAGSGSGTGLYNMEDEDLIEKFITKLKKETLKEKL
jgi:hypothetical protein